MDRELWVLVLSVVIIVVSGSRWSLASCWVMCPSCVGLVVCWVLDICWRIGLNNR